MLKTRMQCLKEYFFRDNVDSMASFAVEIRALAEQEKMELASGAAKALGYTQENVDFALV